MSKQTSAADDSKLGQTGKALGWILSFVAIVIGFFYSSISFSPGASVWEFDVKINGLLVIGVMFVSFLKKIDKDKAAADG